MTKMEVETLRGRNRKAAARYRAKNKEKMTKITINLHSLKETHNCLKQEVSNLQNEVIRLKEAFLSESDLCTPGTCQHYQDFINLYLPRIYDTGSLSVEDHAENNGIHSCSDHIPNP